MTILRQIKARLRRLIPAGALLQYHRARASLAALRYGYPGRRLIVIGVTGTNGKSTVVSIISQLLRAVGEPVGSVSTATIQIKDQESLNATKMTTADPWLLQSLLRRMHKAGCRYAVIEASSEGLAQGRLNGVFVQLALFTNLTPEHIESHGSFEAYARAKEKLFALVSRTRRCRGVEKTTVVNLDDPAAGRYAAYPVDRVVGCTLAERPVRPKTVAPLTIRQARIKKMGPGGSVFTLDGVDCQIPYLGRFNVMNALEAVALVERLGFPLVDIARVLPDIKPVPGRLELVDIGAEFRVLVDYAPEPASMAALYSVLPWFKPKRIIHVFGSCGGGRDRSRRPVLGKFVAERADVAIVTNEDPYDEPAERIIDEVIAGTKLAEPLRAEVMRVPDRRKAIAQALHLAKDGDLVVVTGKAAEQWIMGPRGKRISWDDRKIIRELGRNRIG